LKHHFYWLILLLITLLPACNLSAPGVPAPIDTPTPVVLADTFFSGRAYIDLNGNQLLDAGDSPLIGARFDVMGWGSFTDETGYAWALIPGGWDEPVTARMVPPEGSGYTPVGPAEVILQSGTQTSADFLFAQPAVASATPPPPSATPPLPSATPAQPEPSSTPATAAPTIPAVAPPIRQPGAVRRDLTYCTSQDGANLKMDLYLPQESNGPAPVVVYVHGGGWMSGSKNDEIARTFFGELTHRGYLVAALNYRLAPKYKFPAQIEDVKCAIRHLRANVAEYNLDPEQIGAMGGSAGGHLVSLLGVTDASVGWDHGIYAEQSSRIQAVIDMYGPMDIAALFKNSPQPIGEQVFGVSSNTDPLLESYSPLAYISPDDPPFMILQGDLDGVVPVEQSILLRDRLEAAGVPVQYVLVKNGGHGLRPKGGEMQPSIEQLVQIVADFFDQNLP
jgi:acetyl esterase/lipase